MNSDETFEKSTVSDPIDCVRLRLGDDVFEGKQIHKFEISEFLDGNRVVKTASAVLNPPCEATWDYNSETVLNGPQGLEHKGICVKAIQNTDGEIEMSFVGLMWEFDHATIREARMFGMSPLEIAYWLTSLTGIAKGVEIPDLELDEELRQFFYAVPLKGLTIDGKTKSFTAADFGVRSATDDSLFQPLLEKLQMTNMDIWKDDVPRAWGVVFARNLLEADALALKRAQFTSDLISFALRSGVSHFETRYKKENLGWDLKKGRSAVSLHPWVLVCEADPVKGWIRPVPFTDQRFDVDLDDGIEQIEMFAENFHGASRLGDFVEQTNQALLTERERNIAGGIQRSLRWLGLASQESDITDRFVGTWIALEAILNCIEIPGVFDGNRTSLKNLIRVGIRGMDIPRKPAGVLSISKEMVSNRVFNNDWPLRDRLEIFARAFNVKLKPGESQLVRDLSRIRNEIFHEGKQDVSIDKKQLRRLVYLIERLLIAASEVGYEDVEDDCNHTLEFGKIGPGGGAAPLFLNGKEVPYRFLGTQDEEGNSTMEFVIEGKIYNEGNSTLEFIDRESEWCDETVGDCSEK